MAIETGSKIAIVKGCKALEIVKGTTARVISVEPMGAEYSHQVRVVLQFLNGFQAGKQRTLYARHANRMSDVVVNLNNGNPLNKVQIQAR